MSTIHCRTRNGQRVYRLWSTFSDQYLTEDLTREELIAELRIEAIRSALAQVERETPRRLERAETTGSSDIRKGKVADLNDPWEPEKEDA